MEDTKYHLKKFGFLPVKDNSSSVSNVKNEAGRKASQRHYVAEEGGIYLTSQEAQVSGLIAMGHTIREAANHMCLSHRTVEFYLGNVKKKLGVRSKNELLQKLHTFDFFKQTVDFLK